MQILVVLLKQLDIDSNTMKDSIPIISATDADMSLLNMVNSVSIWLWVAVIEFVLIVWLLTKPKRKKKKKLDLSDVQKSDLRKSENIDMKNLMNSIHHSKELYKELSKRSHPDKFVNTSKQEIAEDIFQRISKNKRSYEQLMLIKEEAKSKLDLIF